MHGSTAPLGRLLARAAAVWRHRSPSHGPVEPRRLTPHPDIAVGVLTHPSRRGLVLPYLDGLDPAIIRNRDWELPPDLRFRDDAAALESGREFVVGHYRCFRGHQEVLRSLLATRRDRTALLIFEDDAVPNCAGWWEIVQSGVSLLAEYEVVSFHGRKVRAERTFLHAGHRFAEPGVHESRAGFRIANGSTLAFLLRPSSAEHLVRRIYDGIAFDVLLANDLRTCVLQRSPFDHDPGHDSVIRRRPASPPRATEPADPSRG